MKDEDIKHLVRTEIRLHERDNPHSTLCDISIRDCPKCEHPVLAKKIWSIIHQCLTCGTKFTCSNECVCRVVGEIKE